MKVLLIRAYFLFVFVLESSSHILLIDIATNFSIPKDKLNLISSSIKSMFAYFYSGSLIFTLAARITSPKSYEHKSRMSYF